MTLEICPKCGKNLPLPLKSSGRQICSCGWTNKPVQKTVAKTLTSKPKIPTIPHFSKKQIIIVSSALGLTIVGVGVWVWQFNWGVACSTKDGKPAYQVLEDSGTEWQDAVTLAGSTSRMSLPPQIARLQDIRRKVESQEWSECAKPAEGALVKAMESTINALIEFLDPDNPESLSQTYLEEAKTQMSVFYQEQRKLMPRQVRLAKEAEEKKIAKEILKIDKEGDGKFMIKMVNRAQQAFHSEKNHFSNSLSDLDVERWLTTLKSYNVEISEADYSKTIVKVFAKEDELKSFAGAVYYNSSDRIYSNPSDRTYSQIICKTDSPAKDIALPTLNGNSWVCGSGSSELK